MLTKIFLWNVHLISWPRLSGGNRICGDWSSTVDLRRRWFSEGSLWTVNRQHSSSNWPMLRSVKLPEEERVQKVICWRSPLPCKGHVCFTDTNIEIYLPILVARVFALARSVVSDLHNRFCLTIIGLSSITIYFKIVIAYFKLAPSSSCTKYHRAF